MSNHSIPRNRRKRKNWRSHLSQQRRIALYDASIEVVRIEARMQMRLSPQAWAEMEARWQALPDLDACTPEQRRDFLIREEAALDEARENGRQEMHPRLIHNGLTDEGARRHIALVERQAEVLLQCSPTA